MERLQTDCCSDAPSSCLARFSTCRLGPWDGVCVCVGSFPTGLLMALARGQVISKTLLKLF